MTSTELSQLTEQVLKATKDAFPWSLVSDVQIGTLRDGRPFSRFIFRPNHRSSEVFPFDPYVSFLCIENAESLDVSLRIFQTHADRDEVARMQRIQDTIHRAVDQAQGKLHIPIHVEIVAPYVD